MQKNDYTEHTILSLEQDLRSLDHLVRTLIQRVQQELDLMDTAGRVLVVGSLGIIEGKCESIIAIMVLIFSAPLVRFRFQLS